MKLLLNVGRVYEAVRSPSSRRVRQHGIMADNTPGFR